MATERVRRMRKSREERDIDLGENGSVEAGFEIEVGANACDERVKLFAVSGGCVLCHWG